MAVNVAIPKLGMSMREATLIEWLFKEGDQVNEGQVVLIIETEKTKWEVEALGSGLLHIIEAVDSTQPVGQVVGCLAETPVELKAMQKESGVPAPAPAEKAKKAVSAPAASPEPPSGAGKRIRISPVARRMAEEQGIDLASVTGTGPGGRIVKGDIEKAIENKGKIAVEPAAGQAPPAEEYEGRKVKATIPIKTGMRRAIAEHMRRSLTVSAQLTVTGEIDMTEIIKLRTEFLKQEESLQTRVTYTDIFVLAITRALKDNPIINSSLIGDDIFIWEDINIGIAVALEGEEYIGGGLIVPVLKDAGKMSLVEISRAAKPLIAKAREGKLMPDDVSGGTFTLTNLGVAGGGYGFGTPIINQPETAILATGAISDRPVVREGEIVIRPIMTCSFTFDHRVIDGYPASIFMSRLTDLLENPLLLL